VTQAARERRVQLAQTFLQRLGGAEANAMLFDWTNARQEVHSD
jgi:hypothetical protein